jgi:hypothetical protein
MEEAQGKGKVSGEAWILISHIKKISKNFAAALSCITFSIYCRLYTEYLKVNNPHRCFLLGLTIFPAWGAASPVHPFDYIYNYGIRHATGTGPLPKRGAPGRFDCGLGTVLLLVTAGMFYSGMMLTGYILGGLLVMVAVLVSTIHFCIPSLIYRSIFGFPPKTGDDEGMMCKTGMLCHREKTFSNNSCDAALQDFRNCHE